jgi:hypothetical protein
METLLAVGVLAIGCMCVAGSFCVGFHFVSEATEQTISAVTADEAFAKVRVFAAHDPNWLANLPPFCVDFGGVALMDPNEFLYPSLADPRKTFAENTRAADYYWQALCRKTGELNYQITVFTCRKIGNQPMAHPSEISIVAQPAPDVLDIGIDAGALLGDDTYIIEPTTGKLYRARKIPHACWAILSTSPGTKSPCIGVFQKTVRF